MSSIQARRVGAEVYVTFTIPSQNLDASQPADVTRVEVLALTADSPPAPTDFARLATRVATVQVAPPVRPDEKGSVSGTPASGAAQGATATIRETLTAAQLAPVPLPSPSAAEGRAGAGRGVATPAEGPPDAKANGKDAPVVSQPPVDPPPVGPRRYYMAVAFSTRNRASRSGATMIAVPARDGPEAPGDLTLAYTADSFVVSWRPVPEVTSYNVYRDEPSAVASDPARNAAPPVPVNTAPLSTATFSDTLDEREFGRERCYRVRAVSGEGTAAIEGEPSAAKCETPLDTFAPAAPAELSAVATVGGIELRWAPVLDRDLAGYRVLRGRAGDATLLPITDKPVVGTRFLDNTVMSGVRYVYAVVAVDSRTPTPNPSPESPRDEETAP